MTGIAALHHIDARWKLINFFLWYCTRITIEWHHNVRALTQNKKQFNSGASDCPSLYPFGLSELSNLSRVPPRVTLRYQSLHMSGISRHIEAYRWIRCISPSLVFTTRYYASKLNLPLSITEARYSNLFDKLDIEVIITSTVVLAYLFLELPRQQHQEHVLISCTDFIPILMFPWMGRWLGHASKHLQPLNLPCRLIYASYITVSGHSSGSPLRDRRLSK